MTKDRLAEKIADITRQKAQAEANVHACTGALQILQQLLEDWDTPEPAQVVIPSLSEA